MTGAGAQLPEPSEAQAQTQQSGEAKETFHRFSYEATGLSGLRMRLLTDIPTNDAGVPQDLPVGITEVISDDDVVGPNLSVRVHPVGEPTQIAYVAFDQLAIYDNE
jgi:hypothetical protein